MYHVKYIVLLFLFCIFSVCFWHVQRSLELVIKLFELEVTKRNWLNVNTLKRKFPINLSVIEFQIRWKKKYAKKVSKKKKKIFIIYGKAE